MQGLRPKHNTLQRSLHPTRFAVWRWLALPRLRIFFWFTYRGHELGTHHAFQIMHPGKKLKIPFRIAIGLMVICVALPLIESRSSPVPLLLGLFALAAGVGMPILLGRRRVSFTAIWLSVYVISYSILSWHGAYIGGNFGGSDNRDDWGGLKGHETPAQGKRSAKRASPRVSVPQRPRSPAGARLTIACSWRCCWPPGFFRPVGALGDFLRRSTQGGAPRRLGACPGLSSFAPLGLRSPNQSRQPKPGERLVFNRTPLAGRG